MSNQMMVDRYGEKRARKPTPARFWIIITAVVVTLAVAWGIWVQTTQDASNPEFQNTGYDLMSSNEVTVSFEVVKKPDATAVCALKAMNASGAPVGWKEVTIGPRDDNAQVTARTEHLFITSAAHTAVVDSCWGKN